MITASSLRSKSRLVGSVSQRARMATVVSTIALSQLRLLRGEADAEVPNGAVGYWNSRNTRS